MIKKISINFLFLMLMIDVVFATLFNIPVWMHLFNIINNLDGETWIYYISSSLSDICIKFCFYTVLIQVYI